MIAYEVQNKCFFLSGRNYSYCMYILIVSSLYMMQLHIKCKENCNAAAKCT